MFFFILRMDSRVLTTHLPFFQRSIDIHVPADISNNSGACVVQLLQAIERMHYGINYMQQNK